MITADILRRHFGFNDPNVIEGILRDPHQRARYEREYQGIVNPGQPVDSFLQRQQAERQQQLARQRAQEEDFLGRFRAAVSGQEALPVMFQRLSAELGLPALRQTAFETQKLVETAPQRQAAATRGFDVNQNQLDRIVAADVAKLAPIAQKAIAQQQFAEGELGRRLQMAAAEQDRLLKPFELEANLLSERIAREITNFNKEKENELTFLLRLWEQNAQLTQQQQERLQRLADEEAKFQRQLQLAKFQTDEQIRQSRALRGGSGQRVSDPLAYLPPPAPTPRQPMQSILDFARKYGLR